MLVSAMLAGMSTVMGRIRGAIFIDCPLAINFQRATSGSERSSRSTGDRFVRAISEFDATPRHARASLYPGQSETRDSKSQI